MKINKLSKNGIHGLTLIETTVVIVILLALILFSFIVAETYTSQARRAGCALVQDKIRKLIHTESNFTNDTLQPGVDYYIDLDYQHIYIEQDTKCPDGGVYTAILDENGTKIQVHCSVHGNLLE